MIHLGERDCSVQRRHQKVLEEAPCPVMTPDLRDRMGAAAVQAAQSVGYEGAGTVEFLLDAEGRFYFLEMNTRLQVEHPVTELVTGLDLVAMQIKVAEGEPLGLTQADVRLNGHAIEARLYAEDPAEGFLPSTGPVELWSAPGGIRVDAGIETGGEISPHYDAMVAKLIAWGETREDCLRRLTSALEDTVLFGPRTNLAFLADSIARKTFVAGNTTTAFIAEEYGDAGFASEPPADTDLVAAAVVEHLSRRSSAQSAALAVPDELLDWSSTAARPSVAVYPVGDDDIKVSVSPSGEGYQVTIRDAPSAVSVVRHEDDAVTLEIDGSVIRYRFQDTGSGEVFLQRSAVTHRLINRARQFRQSEDTGGAGTVTAPMHGHLLSVDVAPGDRVSRGSRIAVLEAMKMQHEIVAELDGTVSTIHTEVGAQIAAGSLILEISPQEDPEPGSAPD